MDKNGLGQKRTRKWCVHFVYRIPSKSKTVKSFRMREWGRENERDWATVSERGKKSHIHLSKMNASIHLNVGDPSLMIIASFRCFNI